MPTFAAADGTRLAYHLLGTGSPLICVPGGMQASAYLGDLGGLSAHRQLVKLDLRGTGESATPADAASYRCDRVVEDVEALRNELGLERIDLLGHSGGANVAVQYAARYPDRVGKLVLITPSVMAVGFQITGEDRLKVARLREGEPWFATAFAALESLVEGRPTDDTWEAIAPFSYGRWDDVAKAHHAAEADQQNAEAAAVFASEGAFDPESTRTALAAFTAPTLVVAGEVDLGAPRHVIARYSELLPNSEFVIQAGAGHFPWLDDADRFVSTAAAFLK